MLNRIPGFANSNNPKLSALRVNDEVQFIQLVSHAIRLNHGVVLRIAKALKVSRQTVTDWVNHYPKLKEVLEDTRESAKLIV